MHLTTARIIASFATALAVGGLTPSFAAFNDATALERAITASEKGDLSVADTEFTDVSPNVRDFRIAFRESQKVLYKKAAWDRFFGVATYYRKNLMTGFFEPDALALEILALIKHCQFEAAEKLIASEQSLVAELLKSGTAVAALRSFQSHLDTFSELLRLQRQMPKAVNTTAMKSKVKAFTQNLEWNISDAARNTILTKAVKNMHAVRLYVKDACPGTPTAEKP